MKKLFLFCAFIPFLVAQVHGQNTGVIKGKLLDNETKETLPGANVVISSGNSTVGCQTDLNGYYVLKPLSSGKYSIKISYMGYKTVTIEGIEVSPGEITFIEDAYVSMEGIIIDGQPVEIYGYKDPLIKPVPVINVSPDMLDNLAGGHNINTIISNLSSDIYVNEDDEIYFRGSRDNSVVYIVDGVKAADGQAHIPSGAIGKMMVYTGGVPANYGDFTGGCVVIETKSFFNK